MADSRYRFLFTNTVLIALSSFASRLLSFLLLPLYTNILSTDDYAVIELLVSTISLMLPIFTVSIGDAMLRFSFDKNIDKKSIFTSGLLVTILGSGLFISAAIIIAAYEETVKNYFVYFIAIYILQAITLIISNFVRGIEKIKAFAANGFLQSFVFLTCNIIFLVLFDYGITGYFLSLIISNLVSVLFLFVVSRCFQYISLRKFDLSLIKIMMAYSVPLIPNTVAWWINTVSDRYIVNYFCGLSVTGIYSVAYKIPSILNILTTIFVQAWQLSAIKEYETDKSNSFFNDIYKYFNMSLVIISSLLIVFNRYIAELFFAKEFYSAYKYVPFILVGFMFSSLAAFLTTIFSAAKKTNILFVSALIGALVNVALNIVLVKSVGAAGAAAATAVSFFLLWIIRFIKIKEYIKLNIDLKKQILCYLTVVVQASLFIMENNVSFILSIVLFIFILIVNIKDIFNAFNAFSKNFLQKRT